MSIHSTLQPFLTAASVQPEFLLPADHAFLKTLSRHFLGPSSNLNDGNAKQKTRGLTEAHPSIMYRKITSYLPHKYIQAFIGNIHPTKPFLRIFWGEKVFQTQSKRLLQVVCNNTLCVWGGSAWDTRQGRIPAPPHTKPNYLLPWQDFDTPHVKATVWGEKKNLTVAIISAASCTRVLRTPRLAKGFLLPYNRWSQHFHWTQIVLKLTDV